MIKIAFIGHAYSKEWMGGVNYISNLLYALSCLEDKKIEPIVFLGKNIDVEIYNKISPYTKVVQDSFFDKNTIKWYIHRTLETLFKWTPILENILKKHEIDILSHSNIIVGCDNYVKINWIPDFQHIHLPEFFTKEEIKKRDKHLSKVMQKSDKVIVSSYNALEDAKVFSPKYSAKLEVLQFVAQPNKKVFTLDHKYLNTLEEKYNFQGKFFYLPNQFWKHKNHKKVFEAINILKNEGQEVLLLCSGHMYDYRNPTYAHELKAFITKNKLEENIRLLGLIDYNDVLYFIRYSIAVINPSLFEGWSSTVEECKSIGKNMLLSNIVIHKEQNPVESLYFNPLNADDIAKKLKEVYLDDSLSFPNLKLEGKAKNNLKERTLEFAKTYQDIVYKSIKEK